VFSQPLEALELHGLKLPGADNTQLTGSDPVSKEKPAAARRSHPAMPAPTQGMFAFPPKPSRCW